MHTMLIQPLSINPPIQEPVPLPADFARLFSQGRLHSLAPDPALLTEALDLYARLNVDRARVRMVVVVRLSVCDLVAMLGRCGD